MDKCVYQELQAGISIRISTPEGRLCNHIPDPGPIPQCTQIGLGLCVENCPRWCCS